MARKPSKWQPSGVHPFGGDLAERYPREVLDQLVAAADLPGDADLTIFRKRLWNILCRFEADKLFASRPTTVEKRAAIADIQKELSGARDSVDRLTAKLAELGQDTRALVDLTTGWPPRDFKARASLFAFVPDRTDANLLALAPLPNSLSDILHQFDTPAAFVRKAQRGRPKKTAEYQVVSRLCNLHAEATGTRPTRIFDTPKSEVVATAFHSWANAVLAPLDITVSDDMVRQAIESMGKIGPPST